MASAIPMGLGALGGIFNAIGGSKPKSSSSTFNQSSDQSANLDTKQGKVNKALFQQILEALKLGPNVSQGDRNTMRGQVNDTYNGATTNLESDLAARGYGESGKVGTGFRDLGVQRANAIQGGEATLRDQAWSKFMNMIGAAFQFDQPRSFSSTSQGTQTGSMSGTPWQSSLGGGLGDASSMLWLRQLNGGGSGGSGGGSNPFAFNPSICWIAIELYGVADWRTIVARATLLERARQGLKWRAVVTLYALTGRHIARLIRWCRPARRVMRIAFDNLLSKTMNP